MKKVAQDQIKASIRADDSVVLRYKNNLLIKTISILKNIFLLQFVL